MTKDERRQQMDPEVVEKLRARLARIKIAITTKKVRELEERVNIIEAVYIAAKPPPKEEQRP